MLSHLFFGFSKGYRKLHKKYGYCLTCNKYSECEITVLESTLKVLSKTIRDHPEAYLFDWAACDHRVGIFDKEDVKRYKNDQVLTENFAIPNRQEMKILYVNSPIRKFTFKHYLQLVLVIIISIILAILLLTVLDKIGVHGPII